MATIKGDYKSSLSISASIYKYKAHRVVPPRYVINLMGCHGDKRLADIMHFHFNLCLPVQQFTFPMTLSRSFVARHLVSHPRRIHHHHHHHHHQNHCCEGIFLKGFVVHMDKEGYLFSRALGNTKKVLLSNKITSSARQ